MSRPPRRLLRGLLLLVFVLLLMPLVLLWLALQQEPAVRSSDSLRIADVDRALRLVQSHDPRRALPGIARTLQLTQHEAELLLNHLTPRGLEGRSKVELSAGRMRVRSSLALPPLGLPLPRWINVDLVAVEAGALPQLESARVGRLPLPPRAVRWALVAAARRQGIGDAATSTVALHRVRFSPAQLAVTYAWGEDAGLRMLATLVPPRDQARLKRYAERLADTVAQLPAGQPVSVSQLLPPMFELARERSAGGDAAQENRVALQVLAMAATGVGLATLLPERAAELRAHPLQPTLAGRRDFTQHFLVSATLAAEGGTPFADTIGLYKELADARNGSGFSFNDIAANRAGTRFGTFAVQDPARFQQRVAGGLAEQDFMPDVADLPEFLPGREFRRRFGGPGSPAYEKLLSEIDGRLDATALFSPVPAAPAPASAASR